MATTFPNAMGRRHAADDRGFFLRMAVAMAIANVAGFALQFAMGRSSFGAPPLVHLHALVFFGWVALFVTQTALAARMSMHMHRRLGWVAVGWAAVMVALGITITVVMVRDGRAPFFFTPGYFLVMNSFAVLFFAGLLALAVAMRRRTDWHRRLMMAAMTAIMGPAFGRLLPVPLFIPYAGWSVFAAMMLFPLAGIAHDQLRHGRVHPAWLWGVAALMTMQCSIDVVAKSGLGLGAYAAVTAGRPSARLDPLAYPPFPPPPPPAVP